MKPLLLLASIALLALGCDREEPAVATPTPKTDTPAVMTAQTATPVPNPTPQSATGPKVLFLGDSLTAGYGLDPASAFPALVANALKSQNLPVTFVNAGVSGDTTAGGLRRLDWLLKQKPDIVVVGLGGNDALRAQPPKAIEDNLRQIIQKSKDAGADVLLLGMLIPPNYGPEYTNAFRSLYPRLANEFQIPLMPFLLEGVGGIAKLNLPDGIHPTAEGHQILAKNVLPHLKPLVEKRSK